MNGEKLYGYADPAGAAAMQAAFSLCPVAEHSEAELSADAAEWKTLVESEAQRADVRAVELMRLELIRVAIHRGQGLEAIQRIKNTSAEDVVSTYSQIGPVIAEYRAAKLRQDNQWLHAASVARAKVRAASKVRHDKTKAAHKQRMRAAK